jgi:hypothetical protein
MGSSFYLKQHAKKVVDVVLTNYKRPRDITHERDLYSSHVLLILSDNK